MVFKPINLARQSFVKTFTHGYAQSLVAASQSSSASQNTSFHSLSNNVVSFFGKTGASNQAQQSAQPPSTSAGASTGAGQPDTHSHEGGLAAYYAAWQTHQKAEEKEWHQFQFAKRIGWKAPTTIPESQPKSKHGVKVAEGQEKPIRAQLERSHTTSALDESRKTRRDSVAEAIALVQVNEAIVKEIGSRKQAPPAVFANVEAKPVVQDVSEEVMSAAADSFSGASPSLIESSSQSISTKATSISEAESYTEHLVDLAEQQSYAEIPVVFEAMLASGTRPSSSAYNALLLAAINLPRGKHQVVPKVLDVYVDMLRRRVLPDTATYAILVELFAARALDVMAMKKELIEKRVRYGEVEKQGSFVFHSDEMEFKILSEDDSMSLAIKLFDTAAAVATNHVFPAETYRLMISATAEYGRIGDMVRIYADMESQDIVPPTAIFAPMIQAFAGIGDLRSAVECYNEYKALAIAHDEGGQMIVRQDEEIYAATVKAYSLCGRMNDGMKFLGKIEHAMGTSERLPLIRNMVALQTLYPEWLANERHSEALSHAVEKLSAEARSSALAAICIDAADKNNITTASEAFGLLASKAGVDLSDPAMAMLVMYVRAGNLDAASAVWKGLSGVQATTKIIEPTTIYVKFMIGKGELGQALREGRSMFARVRNHELQSRNTTAEVVDQIDEAIEVISHHLMKAHLILPAVPSVELMCMMMENGNLVAPLAERLLAGLGPEDISGLPLDAIHLLTQVQAGILINHAKLDIAHAARFIHLFDLIVSSGSPVEKRTSKLVEQALNKLNRADLIMRWQRHQYPVAPPLMSPVTFGSAYHSVVPPIPLSYGDTYDPYGSSTDFKGSTVIAEELEKTYGRHASHLNEALTKFRNMRRVGQHPRYVTYAKLITAAAKENRISLAHDILAMAKQDVPLLPHSRVVRHGWIAILDSMTAACLTVGQRDLADQYHQDLLNMGTAPSANTFGLYITTLKDSTKTFDEATEAVKIFLRAKSEGVEPSSFLYNALIGKLGKARRIDDCLFYFAEMRSLGIRPTSVTYGTIVNALCRVSDEKFAEELFEEMESMPNYKPRPAPYNSLMQYFLTTKRDRAKVLAYYERMKVNNIQPTMHTYKLLIDTYATLEPINMSAAERVLGDIRSAGSSPEAVHYASLIHAKGCVLHDMAGARAVFDSVAAEGRIAPQPSLYQALFESMVANHDVAATESVLRKMAEQKLGLTAYIANTLIHGWAMAKDITKAKSIFESLGREKREPSTYEAMTRAYLSVEDHGNAMSVVGEALRRGYPSAVANKICELVGGGASRLLTV